MQCLIPMIALAVMALAFFGAVALGVYSNYRWMKRFAERNDSHEQIQRSHYAQQP